MKPSSLSATALQVAELCPARYKVEHIDRIKGQGGFAANLGSTVHLALEMYVTAVYINEQNKPSLDLLKDHYRLAYMHIFQTGDPSGEVYDDGLDMIEKWFEKNSFSDVLQVVSCELKETFTVKTSIGEIPFNYIWDRLDQIGQTEYRVIDYKSSRWNIRPEDLKKKIQARVYGLACQIKFPEATKIWVRFDMLRYEPVGIVFTREENIATWKFIKEAAERIIETPDDDAPERLNAECRFCVRKQSCDALQRNISVGGSFGVASAKEAIDKRAALGFQLNAINAAIAELDDIILTEAKEKDVLEFESELHRASVTASKTRAADPERVQLAVGEDIFQKYGGVKITMAAIDKILKDKSIPDDVKRQLRSLIYMKFGEPKVNIESKNLIDDE